MVCQHVTVTTGTTICIEPMELAIEEGKEAADDGVTRLAAALGI
jgi:hypothetical protein